MAWMFAGYTFGYNRPVLAQRCHDLLTMVAFAKSQPGTKTVHMLGVGKAGPWTLLARGLCGDVVARCVVDCDRFRFERIRETTDEMMLPGALKYGGLGALASLAAPGELLIHNDMATGLSKWLKPTYRAAGSEGKVELRSDKMDLGKALAWLTR